MGLTRSAPTRQRDLFDVAVAAAFMFVSVAFLLGALTFNEQARRLPVLVGVPLVLLSVLNVVLVGRGKVLNADGEDESVDPAAAQEVLDPLDLEDQVKEQIVGDERPPMTMLGVLLALVLLMVSVLLGGFLVTAVIYPACFMKVIGRTSIKEILMTVAAAAIIVYALTAVAGAPTYNGLWGPEMRKWW